MAFKRQPRHYITRRTPTGTEYFMNQFCEVTHRTGVVAMPWTNGEPAGFTIDRANGLIDRANKELTKLLPGGVVRIGNIPFGIDELPGFMWHTEPCK